MSFASPDAGAGKESFTVGGIIILGVVLWLSGIGGNPNIKHTINLFLFVLLVSIIMLRWNVIKPLIIKSS